MQQEIKEKIFNTLLNHTLADRTTAAEELAELFHKECQCQTGSAVWVKASDRLPVNDKGEDYPRQYILKGKADGSRGAVDIHHVTYEEMIHVIQEYDYCVWLDESQPNEQPAVNEVSGYDKKAMAVIIARADECRPYVHPVIEQNEEHLLVYTPCMEDDPRCCGGFTSSDGQGLCYVREMHVPHPEQISQDAHEKEVMMRAFDKVRQIFERRQWIIEGRGSYPYNDDRYKEEVRYMYNDFDQLFKDTWANIKSKSIEYRKAIIAEYLKGEQKENEAVEFLQWVADNGWKPRIANEWAKYETIYSDVSVKTTAQLYNEYQKQKEVKP